MLTALVGGSLAVAACSSGAPAGGRAPVAPSSTGPKARAGSTTTPPVATTNRSTTNVTQPAAIPKPAAPTSAAPTPTVAAPTPTIQVDKPLTGKIIAVDPGHNGGNGTAPGIINQLIWNGRENETCDTTGTETDTGYTEAQFNFSVAGYVAADLEAEGATVVLTRTSNSGVGPCVNERAAIGNAAHANAAISIHADGGPPSGRGFAVLEPVADGINDAIVGPSMVLGADIRAAFLAGTDEPVSSYDGVNGIQPRDDLGGLNLSTVPKVLVECANMRNATDAGQLITTRWQQAVAAALAAGLTSFLSQSR